MDLAHGHSPLDEEMSERLAFLELPLREYILVLMEVAEQEGAGTPRDELGRQMVFTALKERSLIPGDGHVPLLIVEIEQSRFLLVANETTDGALEVIQEHVDRLFGATVSMGVSTHIPDWRGFHRGYEQAEEALRHRFYLGGGAIVRYQDLGAPGAAASSDLESSIDIGRLVEYVRAGDLEMTRHELETLERSLGAGTDRGIVRARSIALEIQVLTQRALAEQGLDGGSGIDECLECVSACQTLAELLEQLAVSVTAAAGAIHDRICIAGRTIVDRVTGYLAEHYHRPIRLEDLAREVSKHPKYLCRLIKRETGATFSELLLAVRM
ncbi:MAG: AraC family transcriptional regulator, partial [Chloroflexi bacterium]|nr:AraC family transcriptional regulator [Chloroflexota bacterium]